MKEFIYMVVLVLFWLLDFLNGATVTQKAGSELGSEVILLQSGFQLKGVNSSHLFCLNIKKSVKCELLTPFNWDPDW